MSIFSSIIRNPIVQAIAKPFVHAIPIVGPAVSSRILMSPTPAQANAIETTESAVQRVQATIPAIQAEQSRPAPAPAALMPSQNMFTDAGGKLSTQGLAIIIALLLGAFLLARSLSKS